MYRIIKEFTSKDSKNLVGNISSFSDLSERTIEKLIKLGFIEKVV